MYFNAHKRVAKIESRTLDCAQPYYAVLVWMV